MVMKKALILAVGDEPPILRLLRPTLHTNDVAVVTAADGDGAVAAVEQHHPDLILLDVMMPDMDGPSTFQQLRSDPGTSSIPVVLLTAKVQGADHRRFAELNVDGVLAKPFDPMTLASQVAETLGWQE